jgi:hypothetical protein
VENHATKLLYQKYGYCKKADSSLDKEQLSINRISELYKPQCNRENVTYMKLSNGYTCGLFVKYVDVNFWLHGLRF